MGKGPGFKIGLRLHPTPSRAGKAFCVAQLVVVERVGQRNHDGWPDVIASAANGRVQVFLNTGEKGASRFAPGQEVELPPIIQPRTIMADLNGDGDEDLYLPSTQGACFVERSFLERGYASATLTTIEKSPKVE